MLEAYLKPYPISKILRHIENPGIVRTVIQSYSETFSNIHPCLDIFRDIKAYWGIFRHYWGTLSHIQTNSELYIQNTRIYNGAIFRTLEYSESEAFSKVWRTFRHIQSPSIVRADHSSIFKDIQGNNCKKCPDYVNL